MASINIDDQLPIEETFGNAVVEWNNGSPVIIWRENMSFHFGYLRDDESFGDHDTFPSRVEAQLQRLLSKSFKCSVGWSDDDDFETGHLWIEVWPVADLDPNMEQDDAYLNVLWPAIATLLNVTDPGTFNSEYLFTKVTERKEVGKV